ncbi:tektin-like protein 1 [Discoglossus pictus]
MDEAHKVGAEAWRKASYEKIRVANDLRRKKPPLAVTGHRPASAQKDTTHTMSIRKEVVTPPPFYRELVADACNDFARGYMRDAQNSVYILRHALIETNRQIHRLQQEREMLEKCHANIKRDMVTNKETHELRRIRPKSEQYPDKVDSLLQEEKKGLVSLRKHSENQLHEVARQLKVMQNQRKVLTDLCKERSRVLDILTDNARPNLERENSKIGKVEKAEIKAVAKDALVTCERFRNLHPTDWLKPVDSLHMKDNITSGLIKKAGESRQIREDVILALGNIHNFVQRQKTLRDEIDTSYQLQLGPVSSFDLSVRDRLDRPLVKVLQRHAGTQLPESLLILQGEVDLRQSLQRAQERFDRLHDTRSQLLYDVKTKTCGEKLDRAAARLRERSVKARGERLLL